MGRRSRQLPEEIGDLMVGQVGPLVVGEVAGFSHWGEVEVSEVVPEPVGPRDLEDAIVLAPPDAGWRLYLREIRGTVADETQPRFVGADIPVEPALQVSRLHEVVHPEI